MEWGVPSTPVVPSVTRWDSPEAPLVAIASDGHHGDGRLSPEQSSDPEIKDSSQGGSLATPQSLSSRCGMGSDGRQLHIFFFPLMAPGHSLHMVDMAKLFARRGVRASVLTTPANAPAVGASLRGAVESGHPVGTLLVEFPAAEAGLPENVADVTSAEMQMDFLVATDRLREPFERLLREHRPDAVVTDMLFPWSGEVAEELGVPRLVFHGVGYFSLCVSDALHHHPPPEGPAEGEGLYTVPGIPHRIELGRGQVPDVVRRGRPDFAEVFMKMQAEKRCYVVVVNSFYEMEPDYADHYREAVGIRAWHVGPVSLCNEDAADKAARGGGGAGAGVDQDSCLSWLDSREPSSVVYVCFGSLCRFTAAQLREIALCLEASGHPFIWVVRNSGGQGDLSSEKWLPEGFEERTAGRCLVVSGWAPQILLLNHAAVGGFVTNCGWNSCLEGITAGLPMVAWPMFADQFYNERLLVQVLGVGASIGRGATRYSLREDERPVVGAEELARAVGVVMGGGEDGEGMRRRAKELKEAARRAVGEEGSSYVDMGRLIEELLEKQTRPCSHGQEESTRLLL